MYRINSAFKEYNANSRNKDVGDCVKRSISLALGIDYDDLSKELNKIRKEKNLEAYNQPGVYKTYLRNLGYVFKKYDNITESEFADNHPQGTYLLLVGPEKLVTQGYSNHLVCILDGDIYDSWNSSDDIISEICVVSEESSEFEDIDIEELQSSVYYYLKEYVDKMSHKLKLQNVDIQEKETDAAYTIGYYIFAKVPDDAPKYFRGNCYYRPGITFGHTLYGKANPKLPHEDNYHKLCAKLKQRVYDWLYNENKALSDAIEANTIDVNPVFRGDRKDLVKVPNWARSRITELDFDNLYGEKYVAYMEALPDDPYIQERGSEVAFYANTLRELKQEFEYYKEDYSRFNYEY